MRRDRAQAVVIDDQSRILMVNHVEPGKGSFWCLPGGGVETGETPEQAVVRELLEECRVETRIRRKLATVAYETGESHHTYACEITAGRVDLGLDPELAAGEQILKQVAFVMLESLTVKDLLFVCQSGALAIPALERRVRQLNPTT